MALSTATVIARTAVRWASAAALLLGAVAAADAAGPRDHQMDLKRWEKLKEAERFQLTAADRLYNAHQFKAAADEYEKFLKLYETSEGAPYAQLKYSHCLVSLRKQNAAIKDGYQTLLDYFPDSPEAPIAAILIAQTYREIGDIKPAKKAYAKAITAYPAHVAAVWARLDLAAIAEKENDAETRVNLLRQLTFDVERKGGAAEPCVNAARQYTQIVFHAGNFDEGLKALSTTCGEAQLVPHLMEGHHGGLPQVVHALTGSMDEATRKRGEKLADASCGWLKARSAELLKDEKTKPLGVAAWYAVAGVRHAARQPDKEKAVYDEIVAALGADDNALGHLAQWYKNNQKREEARATYAKFKDAVAGKAAIAASYDEETPRQTDKAVAIYRELAADAATAPKWLAAAAWSYRQGGKPDPAIAMYRELLTADAKNAAEYHFQIAETLYYAHRWKECITAYRGTDRYPHNYQHMAAAHRQLKEYDEAMALYRQVIASSMDKNLSASMYWEISQTQEAAGKKEDAIKTLKFICSTFPKTGHGSHAHARLNEVYKIPVTLGGDKD
ncbi:tetratricopeptide repeat protein [Gemmata sp.]|uniref:tetratricopeptide repeat protein n=1 Tax=Gemmata sp. TaxID=1914242 RepID=UPI003F7024C7